MYLGGRGRREVDPHRVRDPRSERIVTVRNIDHLRPYPYPAHYVDEQELYYDRRRPIPYAPQPMVTVVDPYYRPEPDNDIVISLNFDSTDNGLRFDNRNAGPLSRRFSRIQVTKEKEEKRRTLNERFSKIYGRNIVPVLSDTSKKKKIMKKGKRAKKTGKKRKRNGVEVPRKRIKKTVEELDSELAKYMEDRKIEMEISDPEILKSIKLSETNPPHLLITIDEEVEYDEVEDDKDDDDYIPE